MARHGGPWGAILDAVKSAETVICGVGLIVTTLLIFAQVINRYLLHFEIMFLNDLALYTFIFFMLIAASYTTWKEGHVAVDIFRERVVGTRPAAAAVYRVALVLIAIFLLCLLLPGAFAFMRQAVHYPQWGTLVRWFNESWLQSFVFWSLLLVLLHTLILAGRDIGRLVRTVRTGSGQEEQ